jgi:N-acetylglucosamine-6-phosphate deacetylase
MKDSINTPYTILLTNARLVLPHATAENAGLLIANGRISRILEEGRDTTESCDVRYDLKGLTLFPGFIDVHIHGALGVDTMEADAADLHRVSRFLARNGITAWLPTLVPAPVEDYNRAVSAIKQLMLDEETSPPGARALGVHYEGPFINSAQCGALRPAYFRTFERQTELDDLPVIDGANAAHLITVAPEIAGGIELVGELRRRGWVVSIGHTRADVRALDEARQMGARHLTHFMNAMSPLHHRAPGPIGWGLVNDDVTCDVIADGVHLDPLILKLVMRSKLPERVTLISDSVAPAGLGDGEYDIWGETISVREGRTSNARGSIAGSVITMREAVRLMLSLEVSPEDVARMAATNPARLIGVEGDCGSIEEGKRADLVALDEDARVRLTFIGGRIAFDEMN